MQRVALTTLIFEAMLVNSAMKNSSCCTSAMQLVKCNQLLVKDISSEFDIFYTLLSAAANVVGLVSSF